MSWKTSYFGDQLQTKEGNKPTTDALGDKKLVGIYFSAHWCPPVNIFVFPDIFTLSYLTSS
jgi:hypothetical protein